VWSQPAEAAEALAKAQLEFKAPAKNRKVDFTHNGQRTKYAYADLADVIEAVKEPLGKNGLATIHQLMYDGQYYGLKTSLIHSSGEFVDTWYPLPDPSTNAIKPQAFGSALTYARRYSLSSLVGIASDDDDDGQTADPAVQVPKSEEKKRYTAEQSHEARQKGKGYYPDHERAAHEAKQKQYSVPQLPESQLSKVNPEDIPQTQPDYESQDQSKPEKKKDAGEFVVAIGSKNFDGTKISQISEHDLKEMRKWLETQLNKVPPTKNFGSLVDLFLSINRFLKSVGVE
jgi:hypothetical protein